MIIGRLKKIFYKIINSPSIIRYQIRLKENVCINGRLYVRGKRGKIQIGENVTINSNKSSVPLGYQPSTIMWVLENGSIDIGNNCGISNTTLCSASQIKVEDYVLIGAGTKIFDTDFHSLNFEKRIDIVNDDDRRTKPVLIKKGAFIGANVTILKGVTIGEKAIIGASSVVACDIPDNEIWAGNPARLIKTNMM